MAFGNLGYAFCKVFRTFRAKAIAVSQILFKCALLRHDQRSAMSNRIDADTRSAIPVAVRFIWNQNNVALLKTTPMPCNMLGLFVYIVIDARPIKALQRLLEEPAVLDGAGVNVEFQHGQRFAP